jgi:Na+/glutamate symporter
LTQAEWEWTMGAGWWQLLGLHLLLTAAVAGVTTLIRLGHAKRSAKDRFVGWVVFLLSVGGFLAAGVVPLLLVPGVRGYIGVFSNASMGWVFGLVVGLILGSWLWRHYRNEIEGDEDAR